jgi:histidyl-tRNA synthetase
VRVITLNDDEALIAYAKPIVAELRANMVRVDSDFSATSFKAKISNAERLRVHTMLVIGGRDLEAGAVSLRLHDGGPQGAKPKGGGRRERPRWPFRPDQLNCFRAEQPFLAFIAQLVADSVFVTFNPRCLSATTPTPP